MPNAIRPHVEVGKKPDSAGGAFELDVSRLDQDRLESSEFVWEDLTSRVRMVAIDRGKLHMQDPTTVGTAKLVLNDHDRYLTLDRFKTGRNPVRIGAAPGGPWFFHGTVESVNFRVDEVLQTRFTELSCQDYLRPLASTQIPALTLGQQTCSERVNTLLSQMDLPYSELPRFGTGNPFFSRSILGYDVTGPLLQDIDLCCDVDNAVFYSTKDGSYVYTSGVFLELIQSNPADYEIGRGTPYPFSGGIAQVSRDRVYNDLTGERNRFTGEPASPQRVVDDVSVSIYGRRAAQFMLPCISDAGVLNAVEAYLRVYAYASTQLTPVVLYADRGANAQLIRDIDLYRIVRAQLEDYQGPPPVNMLTDEERGTEATGGSWAPYTGSGAFGFGDIWAVSPYVGTGLWRLYSTTTVNTATIADQKPISLTGAPYVVKMKVQLGAASASATARVGLRIEDVSNNETIVWGPPNPLIAGQWVEYTVTVVRAQLPPFPLEAGPIIEVQGADSEVFFDDCFMYEELEDEVEVGYVERITHRWQAPEDVWVTTLELNTAWHDNAEA